MADVSLRDELTRVRELFDRGDAKGALKQAEQVRRRAHAAGDLVALEQTLELARDVFQASQGRLQSEAGRLAFSAQQNIRFIDRELAVAAGEEWVDPFPSAAAPVGVTTGTSPAPGSGAELSVSSLVAHLAASFAVCFVVAFVAGTGATSDRAIGWIFFVFGMYWLISAVLLVWWWTKGYDCFGRPMVSWGLTLAGFATLLGLPVFLLVWPRFRRWLFRQLRPYDRRPTATDSRRPPRPVRLRVSVAFAVPAAGLPGGAERPRHDPAGRGVGKRRPSSPLRPVRPSIQGHGLVQNAWAVDAYRRTFVAQTSRDGSGNYTVTERYLNGRFVTRSGPSPGSCDRHGGGSVRAGIRGTFAGDKTIVVSKGAYDPTAVCTRDLCDNSLDFVANVYGLDATYEVRSYKYLYRTGANGSWTNASNDRGGDSGDIATGVLAPGSRVPVRCELFASAAGGTVGLLVDQCAIAVDRIVVAYPLKPGAANPFEDPAHGDAFDCPIRQGRVACKVDPPFTGSDNSTILVDTSSPKTARAMTVTVSYVDGHRSITTIAIQ